jgi:phenylalanyl-tRNA synthetase alpha chain
MSNLEFMKYDFKSESFLKEIPNLKTKHEILNLKSEFNAFTSKLFAELKTLTGEEKKKTGEEINILKEKVESAFKDALVNLRRLQIEEELSKEEIDITLPSFVSRSGSIHPVSFVINELTEIMQKYGFTFKRGPEIETDYYNFDALNIRETHPARQMHDTFYLDFLDPNGKNYLLRTHTSSVQIREMEKGEAPFALISAGRTYRWDLDRTHTPMFNQLECLYVNEGVNMGNLMWTVDNLLTEFFEGIPVKIRSRPSYFPFTEPSVEVDIDIGGGFLEVMGAGMVHPQVLENCKIDSKKYSGFALGAGIERLAMLKYGMTDLRDFFNSGKQWNNFYGFRI